MSCLVPLVALATLLPLAFQPARADTSAPAGRAAPTVDLQTVSTRADLVTGGDVLVSVRPPKASHGRPSLRAGGRDVSDALTKVDSSDSSVYQGLVTGLPVGATTLQARDPDTGAGARLTVTNAPVTGPLFSGPKQQPFVCQTESSDLGPAIGVDCQAPSRYRWFYLSTDDDAFHELTAGSATYPAGTAMTTTSLGATVPFVVRTEAGTINRGVSHILVLDDPIARGWEAPYRPTKGWNLRLQYNFGGGCGVGYRQGGQKALDLVNLARGFLGQGYAYATSTLNALGNACNDVLSAETMMMVKERFIETVGNPLYTVGDGGSGGAIMQYMIATGYPGLLDGIVPYATFPDNTTVLMSVFDCRLFQRVFAADPVRWTQEKRVAVTGFATPLVCQDWDSLYGDLIIADKGCPAVLPAARVYNAKTNPGGARCTVHDSNRNIYGTDARTGFGRRPYDNVGVEYGREALRSGRILPEDFVALNEAMGGFDTDGGFAPARAAADPAVIRRLYETGKVVSGDGGLPNVPILDQNLYFAEYAAAGLEVHDRIRAFEVRERLRRSPAGDKQLLLWTYGSTPSGDWLPLMDGWLTAIADSRRGPLTTPAEIQATRPADAADRCYVESRTWFQEDANYGESSRCNTLFAPHATPRMVAGGPVAEDILKCQVKPLDRGTHPGTFSDEQWARLLDVFADGACDWTVPGVEQKPIIGTWLSYGQRTATEPTPLGSPPVAQPLSPASRPASTFGQRPALTQPGQTLPSTGGNALLPVAALALLTASVLTRRGSRPPRARTRRGHARAEPENQASGDHEHA